MIDKEVDELVDRYVKKFRKIADELVNELLNYGYEPEITVTIKLDYYSYAEIKLTRGYKMNRIEDHVSEIIDAISRALKR